MRISRTFAVVAIGALACTVWLGCTGEDATPPSAGSVETLCDELCRKTLATCNTGAKQMFRTTEQCVATCRSFDPGVEGIATGNTIRCRIAEVDKGNCNGAGLLGGDVCGKPCDGFCRAEAVACKAAATRKYDSEGSCVEQCETELVFVASAAQGADQPFTGDNTLNCRAQHLLLSFADPDPHCGHLDPVNSIPCSGPKPGADAGR